MAEGRRIAFFVTPHGYGHAARASAVMNAIREREPGVVFEIFTRVPVWFFNMSLRGGFNYHEVLTDIGLVQSNAMSEDLPETLRRLEAFVPFRSELVQRLAGQVRALGCEMVVCDIAPLGIAVAQAAGLPSLLVENFTWDWIYEGYLEEEPAFAPYIEELGRVFQSAGLHIRTEPACDYTTPADLLVNVVSRKPRTGRAETRQGLGAPCDVPLVLITMGGIVTEYPFLSRLEQDPSVRFLIPGGSERHETRGSLILIPHHSQFYHPDLVLACDAVIGKLGYSTLAEAYAAGLPFAYVPRARFRESPPMAAYARRVMEAVELSEAQFFNGQWLDVLPDLLSRPKRGAWGPNGADTLAETLLNLPPKGIRETS